MIKKVGFMIVIVLFCLTLVSAGELGYDNPDLPKLSRDTSTITSSSTTSTFTDLTDTPSSYTGQGSNCVKVTAAEDGLEFVACGGGGDFSFSDFQASFDNNISEHEADWETTYNSTYDSFKTNVSINYTKETFDEYDSRWYSTGGGDFYHDNFTESFNNNLSKFTETFNSTFNATYDTYAYNMTYGINSTQFKISGSGNMTILQSWLDSLMTALGYIKSVVGDGQKNVTGTYLYNDTDTIYFNDTLLNETIDRIVDASNNSVGDFSQADFNEAFLNNLTEFTATFNSTFNETYWAWLENVTTNYTLEVQNEWGRWFYNMSDGSYNATYDSFAENVSLNHTNIVYTEYGKWFYNQSSLSWDYIQSNEASWLSTQNQTYEDYVYLNYTNESNYWDEVDTYNTTIMTHNENVLTLVISWFVDRFADWVGVNSRITGNITALNQSGFDSFVNLSGDIITGNLTVEGNMSVDGSLWGRDCVDYGDTIISRFNQQVDGANGETGTLTTTNLKGIWHFEEGTGNPTDDSGNSITLNDGANPPDWTADGKYGSALLFQTDETKVYTDTDGQAIGFEPETGDYTAGAWFYANSGGLGVKQNILTKGVLGLAGIHGGWTLGIDASDNVFATVDDSAGDDYTYTHTDTTLQAETWYFIAWTWDASSETIKIYVNGESSSGSNPSPDIDSISEAQPFRIGWAPSGYIDDGIVDEPFCIKGVVLSDGELDLLYNNRWWGRTYLDGKFGTGYYAFTGNRLSYPTAGNIDKHSGTISMWIKPTWDGNDSANHVLFDMETASDTNQLQIIKTSANNLGVEMEDSGGSNAQLLVAVTSSNMAKNTWHHIATTWEDGELTGLYLNGELQDDTPSSSGIKILALDTNMYIGRDATSQTNEAQSIIDEFKIYDRALTSTEILNNYNCNRPTIMSES